MSSVIQVEGLGKKYIIQHKQQERYLALRDIIASKFKGKKPEFESSEEFWALKDVNFEVKQGDRVGVIGRNGAGKSTLLKVLSRITEPTTGKIALKGTVSSLLEVGTGFHPELTGRENIFLNGAILGMTKVEIKKKFDEIVEFAEVEKFLDTPVKRYSSGMYVRLAFAVAANLEPNILVVDEVLAVGDAQFQKKCLGKMEDVSAKEGRTVLFVSHNMPMISSLCDKCILLHKGNLVKSGSTSEVINTYFSSGSYNNGEADFYNESRRRGNDVAYIVRARIANDRGDSISTSDISQSIILEMEYAVLKEGIKLTPNFPVHTSEGVYAFTVNDATLDFHGVMKSKPGVYRSKCRIPGNFFNSGTYSIGFALSTMSNSAVHFYEQNLLSIEITDAIDGVITRGEYVGNMPGVVRPAFKWECEKIL